MERVQLRRRKLGAVAEAVDPLRQHEPPPQYRDDVAMSNRANHVQRWRGQDEAGEEGEP